MASEVHLEASDDDISVTSTIDEQVDSDQEWPVRGILAEAQVRGVEKYLVQWDGYELCDATWEPPDNLNEEILAEWAETKKQTGRNKAPGFKVRVWREAAQNDIRAKFARHEARNRKRARLGLAQPTSQYTLQECLDGVGGPSGDESSGHSESDPQKDATSDEDEPLIETIKRARRRLTALDATTSRANHDTESRNPSSATHSASSTSDVVFKSTTNQAVDPFKSKQKSTPKKAPRAAAYNAERPQIRQAESTADPPAPREALRSATATARRGDIHAEATISRMASNVFTGGKVDRQHITLVDASSDPKRTPKMLKHRQQRQLEKASRDGEGIRAPARLPGPLYSLGSGNPLFASPFPTTASVTKDYDPGVDPTSVTDGKQLLSRREKQLRVRWSDELTILEQTPDATDSSLFLSDDHMEMETAPNSCPQNLGPQNWAETDSDTKLTSHGASESTQSVISRVFILGHDGRNLELSFLIMASTKDPWVHQLQTYPRLVLSHTCSAQDIISQSGYAASESGCLAQGAIVEGEQDWDIIRTISSCLNLASLAIACYIDGFCLLLYPSTNEEWQSINAPNHATETIGKHLSYCVFPPGLAFQQSMLAPISLPTVNILNGEVERSEVSKLFFDFEYKRLLPLQNIDNASPSFFLAFPLAAREEALLISQWLRQHSPDCVIQTSLASGDWSNFTQLGQGTVIIHESVVWALRLFPDFSEVLHASAGKFAIWKLSRSPKKLHEDNERQSLGVFKFGPIFGQGLVILITPSFMVSQPEQTYNFLKWFWQNYTRESQSYHRGRLAVAEGIDEWLLSLAVEKRDTGLPHQEKLLSAVQYNSSQARFKSWNIMRQLVADTTDDEDGPLIYGPSILDGNDEQSLVNWFGTWTVLHCEGFRKLSVLGSSEQTASRLSRHVKPQRLIPSSAIDMNTADYEPESRLGSDVGHEQQGQWHRLKARDIRKYFQNIEKDLAKLSFNPVTLYQLPISYWTADMAFYFGDYTSELESYRKWFNDCVEPIFARVKRLRSTHLAPYYKNTCVGLFWTLEGAWDSKLPRHQHAAKYRPWAAVYRPADLHHKPWTRIELLIADALANHEHSHLPELHEANLIPAQQNLINFLHKEGEDSTRSLPLHRVWLGGLAGDQLETSKELLDVTLNWVGRVPANVKDWFPPNGNDLPKLGWRLVKPGKASGTRGANFSAQSDTSASPPALNEIGGSFKVVLNPPPGDGSSRKSKCRNHLYDHMAKNMGAHETEYTFRPTMKWYGEQVEEGRGFQHIKVTTWETVFTRYKIHDPKKV